MYYRYFLVMLSLEHITLVYFLSQKPLSRQAKAEILSELKTTSLLTPVCDSIETVMGFLQRRGINPRKKLKVYMEKNLGMVGRLSSEKV